MKRVNVNVSILVSIPEDIEDVDAYIENHWHELDLPIEYESYTIEVDDDIWSEDEFDEGWFD